MISQFRTQVSPRASNASSTKSVLLQSPGSHIWNTQVRHKTRPRCWVANSTIQLCDPSNTVVFDVERGLQQTAVDVDQRSMSRESTRGADLWKKLIVSTIHSPYSPFPFLLPFRLPCPLFSSLSSAPLPLERRLDRFLGIEQSCQQLLLRNLASTSTSSSQLFW